MKLSNIVLAAFLSCSVAFGQSPPPLAFKELILGEPLGAGSTAKRLECSDGHCSYSMQRTMTRGLSGSDRSTASSKERAEALLNIMETIGGYPVDNLNVELDGDGRIESIYISFATRAFDTIRLGFKDKYPSLRCEASVVQNRMGANFDQEECFYTDAMGALTIKKRAGKIDDASVLIVTNQVVEKSTQRKRKGTKDL